MRDIALVAAAPFGGSAAAPTPPPVVAGPAGPKRTSKGPNGPSRADLTSLDERLGLLLLVRLGMAAVVVLGSIFFSSELGITVSEVGPLSAAYVTFATAVECFRRRGWRGKLLIHRAMLPIDALYLAIVTAPGGGPRSQLVVLFSVQLIAVTLLCSQRTGIRIALWDSFLFVIIPTLSLTGRIGQLLGASTVVVPPAAETALAIMGFWVVAVCTAFFSSVSERELRRGRGEMTALADMAGELEVGHSTDEILAILLRSSVNAFGFKRGAVYWAVAGDGRAITCEAVGADGTTPTRERALAMPAVTDQLALAAISGREPLLVRAIAGSTNPYLADLLPGARNVVVLAVPAEGQSAAIVGLEYGGHPFAQRLPRRTLVVLNQFAAHAALALRSARLLSERERLATMDGLTGLANRREFDQALVREISRAERSKEPLSLVVLDVDHFKAINDSRGHLAGDEVLRQIAQVLRGAVREMDLVARYGGEEFALVLPRCAQPDAVRVVERISNSMAANVGLGGVTMSSGLATLPFNAANGFALVEAADEALYDSKRAGRNRLTLSTRENKDWAPAPGRPL
jgi:diguanylate cyclase (GGDEF)-like protein